ncbi:MAG: hydroxyacylglutathione hydrolase [Deltaproteobacteria bacterium GWA2_45_12]|nr:MAG: hydroxyacylglutathione hydrolase [Deltaproteobacteria bacterium GWA2_45_12]
MKIIQIPALQDNYTYLLICEKTGEVAAIDSPDAQVTKDALRAYFTTPLQVMGAQQAAPLRAIWNTHHHWDHTGGNEGLVDHPPPNPLPFPRTGIPLRGTREGGLFPLPLGERVRERGPIPVFGGAYDRDRIYGLNHPLKEGDEVRLGGLKFKIIDIPGHTLGHIAYYGHGVVFCGDTLFVGGCGRLFEGTAEQMVSSLNKLKNLPDETKVYCMHEYTQKNLEFALILEPGNKALQEKYRDVVEKRKRGESTVPSTIGEEKSYNPFLRCGSVEEFAKIRALKDKF